MPATDPTFGNRGPDVGDRDGNGAGSHARTTHVLKDGEVVGQYDDDAPARAYLAERVREQAQYPCVGPALAATMDLQAQNVIDGYRNDASGSTANGKPIVYQLRVLYCVIVTEARHAESDRPPAYSPVRPIRPARPAVPPGEPPEPDEPEPAAAGPEGPAAPAAPSAPPHPFGPEAPGWSVPNRDRAAGEVVPMVVRIFGPFFRRHVADTWVACLRRLVPPGYCIKVGCARYDMSTPAYAPHTPTEPAELATAITDEAERMATDPASVPFPRLFARLACNHGPRRARILWDEAMEYRREDARHRAASAPPDGPEQGSAAEAGEGTQEPVEAGETPAGAVREPARSGS